MFAEPENRIQSNIGMELMPLVPLEKAISSDDRISMFCVGGTTHPGRYEALLYVLRLQRISWQRTLAWREQRIHTAEVTFN